MFYSGNTPHNTKSNLRITLSDFSRGINTSKAENIIPLNYAVNTYNFDFNSGGLKSGLGFKELEVPTRNGTKKFIAPSGITGYLRFWIFRRYDVDLEMFNPAVMVYCDDKKVYYGRLNLLDNTFHDLEQTFDEPPTGINYRLNGTDSFLTCSKNKMYSWDYTNTSILHSEVPEITSAALHAGRLFATTGGDKSRLWFSDNLDPTNWKVSNFDGGYIELTDERGPLKKVIESNNYLYVIREYGISRVSGWGLQEDFTVRNLYLTTGKLYSNSAVLCGHTILMLCRDGLYYFNGTEINKLNLGFDKFFEGMDNENACAAFLDGKYYLACRLNFDDDECIGCEAQNFKNNALIEYDLNNGQINIMRGLDIISLTAFQTENYSKLVACVNNSTKLYELTYDGAIEGVSTAKVWSSPKTDMGYPAYRKLIKRLHINTKSDITFKLTADDKIYSYKIKGSEKTSTLPINIIADKFSFSIVCNNNVCEITNPQMEVSLL